MVKKNQKKLGLEFWKQKILGFFIDGPNTLFLNEMSFPRKNNAVSYSPIVSYVSFRTSLMQVLKFHFLRMSKGLSFSIKVLPSSDIDVEDKFFLHICGKKRLDCNLRLKREKSTNCTQCFHSTLRWKGKNQQNWKESSELKIAPKTKNQYSCRRGCQNVNLACRFLI